MPGLKTKIEHKINIFRMQREMHIQREEKVFKVKAKVWVFTYMDY